MLLRWMLLGLSYKLCDLDCYNCKFTRSNNIRDGTFTRERLDIVVATKSWYDLFGDGEV